MPGEMHWFRWHHGSVTDPKFQLVARRSGASLPDVLAVWAFLLEAASAGAERGCFGEIDTEALDCLFAFPSTETRTADILSAMRARGLIEGNKVVAWSKRQPKRERDTASEEPSTDRVRAFRERQAAKQPAAAIEDHETPRNATKRQKRPRGEERRGNTNTPPPPPAGGRELFDRFFAQFHESRRDKSEEAFKLWCGIIERGEATGELMLQAVTVYASSKAKLWEKDGGRSCCLPTRWLREERWRDAQAGEGGGSDSWASTRSGIEAMGERLLLGKWDEAAFQRGQGEAFPAYEARVRAAVAGSSGQTSAMSH